MKSRHHPICVETLRELIDYDPLSGGLTWNMRCGDHFRTEMGCLLWNAKHAGRDALTTMHKGYRRGKVFGVNTLAHRVAWALHYGDWPAEDIDHINHSRADNRIENLRACTRKTNCRNKTKNRNNTSGVTGLSFSSSKNCWVAYIKVNFKMIYLGQFINKNRAIVARKQAESTYGFHANHGRAA